METEKENWERNGGLDEEGKELKWERESLLWKDDLRTLSGEKIRGGT